MEQSDSTLILYVTGIVGWRLANSDRIVGGSYPVPLPRVTNEFEDELHSWLLGNNITRDDLVPILINLIITILSSVYRIERLVVSRMSFRQIAMPYRDKHEMPSKPSSM